MCLDDRLIFPLRFEIMETTKRQNDLLLKKSSSSENELDRFFKNFNDNESCPLLLFEKSSYASYSESENHFGDSRRSRRPFHYKSLQEDIFLKNRTFLDSDSQAVYDRFRYYSKLSSPTDDTLRVPDHVVPNELFFGIPNPVQTKVYGNQSSLVTVFVIWNTMVGTSLLSMPWAISQAGLTCGLLLMIFMATLCFYTAYRIICVQKYIGFEEDTYDFSYLCSIFLGRWGMLASVFFSLCTLLGATIVCWVLSTNFLYHIVLYIYDVAVSFPGGFSTVGANVNVICPNQQLVNSSMHVEESPPPHHLDVFSQVWDIRRTVPLVMVFVLGPLLNFKSPDFFAKFSALGTLSVLFLVMFVTAKVAVWGLHVDFVDVSSTDYVPHFKGTFFALTGTLSLSLFIHNCILSILRNQKNPENNSRDLGIAYVLVTLTLLFIGCVFYVGFPLAKSCIADNFLDNISGHDFMAFIARSFLFFQILSVCPLLVYIFRIQFMFHMFGSIYPGFTHILLLNVVLIAVSVLFAIFLPSIGTIIRFSGAFCGLAYIFFLPCLTHLASLREQQKMSVFSVVLHTVIMLLGIINFIAQFIYV